MKNRIVGILAVAACTLAIAGVAPYTASAQQDRPSPQDPAANRGPQSQSPYLQMPAHLLNLPAIVPPAEKEFKLPVDSLATSVYEVESKRSYQVPKSGPLLAESSSAGRQSTPGYQGLLDGVDNLEGGISPQSIIGGDGRVQV